MISCFTKEEYEELLKEDLLNRSYKLVSKLFADKFDKAGIPYIEHLKFVSNSFTKIDYQIVGLLHDTLEDTDLTYNDLIDLGYPKHIVDAVSIITRKQNESYSEFIDRILKSNNLIAIRVKEKDMFHNSSEERLKKLNKEDSQRLKNKYKNEYIKINEYLKGR